MSIRVLQNGDVQLMSGIVGTVASVTASCNLSGKVTFTLAGTSTVKGTFRPAPGYSFAHTSADAFWRAGLLVAGSRYAVICQDPYYGRRINAPGVWSTCQAPWSTTLTMGAEYTVKPQNAGVSFAAGSNVDLIATWSTVDGAMSGLAFGGTYPYASLAYDAGLGTYTANGVLGRFETSGPYLRDLNPYDSSYSPIIVPTGHGAWGQKSTDLMHSGGDAPSPEGYLAALTARYTDYPQTLTADATTVLNIDTCKIFVSGPTTSATVTAYWYDGIQRYDAALNASGVARISALWPGTYTLCLFNSANKNKGMPRQTTVVSAGSSVIVNFGTTWTSAPLSQVQGILYAYGAVPLGNETIILQKLHTLSGTQYVSMGSTAADGTFGPWGYPTSGGWTPIKLIVNNATYGAEFVHLGAGAPITLYWDPCLSAYCAVHQAAAEGFTAWGQRGAHVNFPAPWKGAYLEDNDGAQWSFAAVANNHGQRAGPLPKWKYSTLYSTPGAFRNYKLWDGDVSGATIQMTNETNPAYDLSGTWDAPTRGQIVQLQIGGKVLGNVVGWSADQVDSANPLAEADRMGLEWGDLAGLYDRLRTYQPETNAWGQTLTAIECPYCQGPVETEPGAFVRRGYCRNCGGAWADSQAMDARTYFCSPPIGAQSGCNMAVVRQPANADYVRADFSYHWRPEDYQEDNTYLTQSGRGQETNAQRWFAQHIHYGTYSGGTWTANQTISAVEASQGRTLGPGRVKAVFPNGYTYTGGGVTFRARLTRGDGATESQLFTVETGDGRADAWGTYVPVNRVQDLVGFEVNGWNARAGLYEAVTSCDVVAGTSGDVQFSLVNASPHLQNTAGVAVSHQTATPVALEWRNLVRRNPDLWFGPWRRLYLAWRNDDFEVGVQKSDDAGRTWTAGVAATAAGYDYPAIEKRRTGELIVNATKGGSPSVVKTWVSRDDGTTWASTARSFAGTRFDTQPHLGLKQMGALTSGSMYYLNGLSAWSTLHQRVSGNAAATTLQTYTEVTSDAANERAAVVRQPGGRLTMALENAAGHTKFWQATQDGLTWYSGAVSVATGKPDLAQAGLKQYLATTSGTTHYVKRGLNAMSTALPWNSTLAAGGTTLQASAAMVANVDGERPALVKCNAWGRPLVAAVTKGGTVEVHESRDDGLSWGRIS